MPQEDGAGASSDESMPIANGKTSTTVSSDEHAVPAVPHKVTSTEGVDISDDSEPDSTSPATHPTQKHVNGVVAESHDREMNVSPTPADIARNSVQKVHSKTSSVDVQNSSAVESTNWSLAPNHRRSSVIMEIGKMNSDVIFKQDERRFIPVRMLVEMLLHASGMAVFLSLWQFFVVGPVFDSVYAIRHRDASDGSPSAPDVSTQIVLSEDVFNYWYGIAILGYILDAVNAVLLGILTWGWPVVRSGLREALPVLLLVNLGVVPAALSPWARFAFGYRSMSALCQVMKNFGIVFFIVWVGKRGARRIRDSETQRSSASSERDMHGVCGEEQSVGRESGSMSSIIPTAKPDSSDTEPSEGVVNRADVLALPEQALPPPSTPSPSCSARTTYRLPGARGWINIAIGCSVLFIAHCSLRFPALLAAETGDVKKAVIALVLWPVFREMIIFNVRTGVRGLCFRDPTRRIELFLTPVCMCMGLIGRFLFCSMETFSGVIVVSLLQAVQEVFLRQTFLAREVWIARFIKRWPESRVQERFFCEAAFTYRTKVVICDMYAEYVAIFITPVSIMLFSNFRHVINLGYKSDQPVDIVFLIVIMIVQCFAEVVVDILCCAVENKRGLKISDTWIEMGVANRNHRSRSLLYTLVTLPLMINFLYAFRLGFAPAVQTCITERDHRTFENFYLICEPACLERVNYSVYVYECGAGAK